MAVRRDMSDAFVEIQDDGRGIDWKKVAAKAQSAA